MRLPRIVGTARGTRRDAFAYRDWALLGTVGLMWGSLFLFIEVSLEAFRPGLVTFLQLLIGAGTLALLRRTHRPVAREDWFQVGLLGLLWMAIPLLLLPVAQQWIDSSLAGMLQGATPLLSTVIACTLLRQRPSTKQSVGLSMGFLGVGLIALPASRGEVTTLVGTTLVLLATGCAALATNLAVPLQQRYGGMPIVFRAQLVALVVVLPFGIASLHGSRFSWISAASTLALGSCSTGLAYVAMTTLVGRVGAVRGSVAVYFIPLVATFLGVTLRGETVTAIQLGGMGLVILGAYLTSRPEPAVQRSAAFQSPRQI